VTTRITRVETEPFKSEGKVMVNAGWLAVYGKEAAETDDAPSLVPVKPNETVKTEKVEIKPTRRSRRRAIPKPRCSARWRRGKLVEDENCARR